MARGVVKKHLEGKHINSDDKLDTVKDWVSSQPQEFWEQGILHFVNQWHRYAQANGTDTVDSTPDEKQSQTPVEVSPVNNTSSISSYVPCAPTYNGDIMRNHSDSSHDVTKSPELTPQKGVKEEMVLMQKAIIEGEIDTRRKRYPTDRAYFIAKELLMTERTFRKDLEVINLWFRDEVSKEEEEMPDDVLNLLFALVDPIYEYHCGFLREIEQRLAMWEGRSNAHLKGDHQRIGDIVFKNLAVLPRYHQYLEKHFVVLERLDTSFRLNKKFEQLYRDFELQKVCYLPLTSFILKPLQRLLHYQNLLDRLLQHYDRDHADYNDCYAAQNRLAETVITVPEILKRSENFVQLCELQRDISGFDSLVQTEREFLRQGCLLKHSRKGYQQRMFFLFSDILLYTNRSLQPSAQFRVHGQMPLRGVMVDEADNKMGASYCFNIYGGNRVLTVAASSQDEKDKWMEDISTAVQVAKERGLDSKLQYLSLKSCSSSDEVIDKCGEDSSSNREKASSQRSNTTVHVCWHRNTSISMDDQLKAVENQLSGYLLRKFKNSNGWQKLWVVFTNFCLFFYKTFQDDFPLASLPLLGYSVSTPSEKDSILKDFVFKLQFKNHVYFFRAESEYTFSRWMEVISSATQNCGYVRMVGRKDNHLDSQ